jgi:type 1 fimbriae regulatory protein FimB/type 1 fimbriae regulatory protein FimE
MDNFAVWPVLPGAEVFVKETLARTRGCRATRPNTRAKNGNPSAHPLRGDEVRALRELRRQSPDSAFVFTTERGGPFTPDAINQLVKRIGARARFAFPVHAHMLRHACG